MADRTLVSTALGQWLITAPLERVVRIVEELGREIAPSTEANDVLNLRTAEASTTDLRNQTENAKRLFGLV